MPVWQAEWIEHDDVIVTGRIGFEEFKRIGLNGSMFRVEVVEFDVAFANIKRTL